MARTFQNIRLFNEMSVLDNVKVGLHNQIQYGMLDRHPAPARLQKRKSTR